MYRSLIASGMALLAVIAIQPNAAQAGTNVDVTIGESWYPAHYYPDYPVHYPNYPGYDDEDEDDYDYITCQQGRRVVRQYGFRQVTALRCGGEVYKYRALQHYRAWIVRVSARSGQIISVRIARGYY
jgi:hypothetical protein